MTQPSDQTSESVSPWTRFASFESWRGIWESSDTREHTRAISRVLLTLLFALVCLRAWVFVRYAQAQFDSDQAVFGLMAKDISLGRAYPLFVYGRRYMLAVGAWLCAPLFAMFGTSVTALKFPMFLMNLACVLMLWVGLRRERGIGPWGATLAIVPFAAASIVTSSRLLEHAGGNIEPFVFLLLAYLLRERAIALGIVFGLAYLNREFTPIGVVALVMMDVAQGHLRSRLKLYGIALLSAVFVVCGLRWLAEGGTDYFGPTVSGELLNPFDGRALSGYFGTQLPVLLGTARIELNTFLETRLHGGQDWLRYAPVAWGLLGVAGALRLRRADLGDMSTYVLLIGLGQLAAFFLFCGMPWHSMLIRYVLLTLCLWMGLTAYAWKTPALRPWIAAVVLIIGISNVRDHIRVARKYMGRPPQSENGKIAQELERRGVRYAKADFWLAYATTFLADERVIVSPRRTDGARMNRYLDELSQHKNEVIAIQSEPCKGGKRFEKVYLCPRNGRWPAKH